MTLTGTWRLVSSRAWDEAGNELAPPYGDAPLGTITFSDGRMLAALCTAAGRSYSSYGGKFSFDGQILRTTVDVASDPTRIGGVQERAVRIDGDTMILCPPLRRYEAGMQRREIVWQKLVLSRTAD